MTPIKNDCIIKDSNLKKVVTWVLFHFVSSSLLAIPILYANKSFIKTFSPLFSLGFWHYINLQSHYCIGVLKMSTFFVLSSSQQQRSPYLCKLYTLFNEVGYCWKVHLRAHFGPEESFSISWQKIRTFQHVRVWEMCLEHLGEFVFTQ